MSEEKCCIKLDGIDVPAILDSIRQAGEIILGAKRTKNMKDAKEGHGNWVTTYDKMVQEFLKDKLTAIVPQATFVGEEEDIHASIAKGLAFIVDPIDGTLNFIKDYKCSSISVGITLDGNPLFGAVYNPYMNEMFTAAKDQGAYLNGEPIHVSDAPLSDALVVIGTAPYYVETHEQSFKIAYHYFKVAQDIRRGGSAAIDLCNVAAGRADMFFEMRLQPWDFAAGALIVTEAGGVCTDMQGNPLDYSTPSTMVARNAVIDKEDCLYTGE